MAWSFEQAMLGDTLGNVVTGMCFDGRDMWVVSHSRERLYAQSFNHWDSNDQYIDENSYFGNAVHALRRSAIIKVWSLDSDDDGLDDNGNVTGASNPAFWYDHVYVMAYTSSGTKLFKININTKEVIQIDAPYVGTHPHIVCANNKVWTCFDAPYGVAGTLYCFDIATSQWSAGTVLPGRSQGIPRQMVDGLDGKLLITAHNEHSVIVVNTSTGAVVGSHRVNRHPYAITANQDKQVYVVSDKQFTPLEGMVSYFDQMNNVSTPFAVACGSMACIEDNGKGYLWYGGLNAKLGRLRKSDLDFRYVGGEAPGFTIDLQSLINANPNANTFIKSAPALTYIKWDDPAFHEVHVEPYIYVTIDTAVYAFRDTAMVRKNTTRIRATAMISIGSTKYYGD